MNPSRALYFIAGVDYETLVKCPKTDRLWAAHLGFSLILSFLVVGAITYHATSYVIADFTMRFAVSLVVALTVLMFDRALYQADWFLQASPEHSEWNASRMIRICVRLGISLCLSFALAMFLELAIFSDTITEKLQDDFRQVNAPLFQKALDFESTLDEQIAERREALAAAEKTLVATSRGDPRTTARLRDLQARLLPVTQQVARFEEDKNAELFGRKTRSGQTGVAGRGPAYQFAVAQIENLAEEERRLRDAIATIRTEETTARTNAQEQINTLRGEVTRLVDSRAATATSFRQTLVVGSPEFQKQKDDPLARMQAYAELKQDPGKGTAIVLFSWLVRLFVSFLEVVPVAAKMFFCPPGVYGSMVAAEVLRERRRVERIVTAEDSGGLREANITVTDPNPARYRRVADVLAKNERRLPEIILKKRGRGEDPAPAVG